MKFYFFQIVFVIAVVCASWQPAFCQIGDQLQKRVGEIAEASAERTICLP